MKLEITPEEEVRIKMFLFTRWCVTCYSNEEMNTQPGNWWKNQLEHFEKTVYPNYLLNNTIRDTSLFILKK